MEKKIDLNKTFKEEDDIPHIGGFQKPPDIVSFFERFIPIIFQGIFQFFFIDFIIKPLYFKSRIWFYILIIPWSLSTIIWLLTYYLTSWADPGSLKKELIRQGYLKEDGITLVNLPVEIDHLPRCPKCGLPKPARTHHCSTCNECIFRFDHHCPFIGNCVGLYNLKSFILFLYYSALQFVLLSFFVLAGIKIGYSASILTFSLISGLTIGGFLAYFASTYIRDLCQNRTTLEGLANDQYDFNEGWENNIKQIYGHSKWLWVFPTRPTVNGFTWSIEHPYQ